MMFSPVITTFSLVATLSMGIASAFTNHNPFGARAMAAINHRGLFGFMEGSGADHFDMDELKQRIEQETNPYFNIFNQPKGNIVKRPKPVDVHIILFKPHTEEEGVHTIEYPKGSGNNVILAFESKEECDNFAGLLKAQQFFDPSPQEMNLKDLEKYCHRLGVFVQVVPEGMHIVPPAARVDHLGHNPKLRDQQYMLDYLFDLSDTEPEEEGVLEGEFGGGGSWE